MRKTEVSARVNKVSRILEDATNVTFILNPISSPLSTEVDLKLVDNKILTLCKNLGAELVSNDINMRVKAKALGIPTKIFNATSYSGIVRITSDTKGILEMYSSISDSFYPNQYIIITNTELNTEQVMIFRNNTLENLIYPSTTIKALNIEQQCAIDLMYRRDIPIKILKGCAGSGKTKIAVETSYHKIVDLKKFKNMTIVRNPVGPGADIGFLKGDFDEKTEPFFEPIIDTLGEATFNFMMDHGMIDKQIPKFCKGRTLSESIVFVDEAEDLDLKQLKLLGSRVGEGSQIIFSGDYKQAEAAFVHNSGLNALTDLTKHLPEVGVVELSTNVRSDVVNIFNNL
jgi:predicted ribonuclease YlaK